MQLDTCNAYVARDEKVIAPASHLSYFPLVVHSVKGATITDVDGNEFIDFLSSASSLNLGSLHERVISAVQEQLERYTQYTVAYTYNPETIHYAEALTGVYPGGVPAKICFGNCGSDANDAAVKFSRGYTGRSKVIVFHQGYHGSTYGAMSMSTVTTRMGRGMGPLLPEIYPFPFCGPSDDPKAALKPMLDAFATYLAPDEVACMVIEPVQGDSGIVPAHPEFIQGLYDLCQEHGILFIAEEVQQAFGRTGKWFSIEQYGIVPDGIIMGKSIGAGFTLGAFMAKSEIIDALPAPAHLFTLGGNALACTAGLAQFKFMQEGNFFDEVNQKGEVLKAFFQEMKETYGIVGEIRGFGLSIGVDIINKETGEKDSIAATKISYRCYEKGMIMITLGGNVLRIQPPLIISEEEIATSIGIWKEVFAELANGEIPDSVLENSKGW